MLGIFHGSSCGSHAGLVLLYRELSLAHFDGDPVLGLLQRHLRLAELEFTSNLHRLGSSVAQWNVQLQPRALVGSRRVDQLIESASIANGTDSRGRTKPRNRQWAAADAVVALASAGARAPVIGEKVEGGLQRASQGFVALLLAIQLDASFHQFGAVM